MKLDQFLKPRGSVVRLAKAINVAPSLISQFKNGTRNVPRKRCHEIDAATDGRVTCEEMRPDLNWAFLRSCGADEYVD